MIFYKKPFVLNNEIENKEIKNVIEIFRKGNFNNAQKQLSLIKKDELQKDELQEYEKLEKMLKTDKTGIFAVLFMLTIIIFLFIDFIGN